MSGCDTQPANKENFHRERERGGGGEREREREREPARY